jgi:hypothetical protein
MNESGHMHVEPQSDDPLIRQQELEQLVRAQSESRERAAAADQRSNSPTRSIPVTELPEAKPDYLFAHEWNLYRREVGHWLAEGKEQRWVVIVEEEIIGFWQTQEEANRARLERFPGRSVFMKQILAREPVIRRSWRFSAGSLD